MSYSLNQKVGIILDPQTEDKPIMFGKIANINPRALNNGGRGFLVELANGISSYVNERNLEAI